MAVLSIPPLAKLGDLFGYKRLLCRSAGITAAATLALAAVEVFPLFLAVWSLQGAYMI